MKQFKHLFTAAMLAFAVTACDEGTDGTGPDVTGTVSGAVTVEGAGQGGVGVTLTGTSSAGNPVNQTTTTDGSGNYSFPGVPSGTYVVSITPPAGTTFTQTGQPVSISVGAPGATASFAGEFIRTSAISGTVSATQGPLEGVQVQLSGDENRSTTTSAAGGYSFTGLKAGSYTVTITPPPGVDFSVTSQSVTLGTGDAEVVSFAGDLPSTASVSIKSITRGTTATPVNPSNVFGQIDVTLNVEPGNDVVESVILFVDGEEVGRQDFSSGVLGEEALAAGEFEVVFPILTADFDDDGTPDFLNGQHEITASINTRAGGASSATTSQTLTFNNSDTFFATMTAENGPVQNATTGRPWTGGDHTVDITGVAYSGKTIGTVTVTWNGVGALTANATPFQVVFQNSTTPAVNIAGYQTDLATGTVADRVSINSANYSDGTPVALPTQVAGFCAAGAGACIRVPGPVDPAGVLADNLAPLPGTLVLPEQSLARTCCFNSWTNGGYTWATGHTATGGGGGVAPSDGTGVGGIDVDYHAGASTLNNAGLVALDPSDDASGLASSGTNGSYSVAAVVADALGNAAATIRLAANGSNNNANANGQTFGIDNIAPTIAYAAGSPANMSINPAGPNYNATLTDMGATASGFGPAAQRSRGYGNFTTAATATGTGTNCFYGAIVTSTCSLALTPAGGNPIPTVTPTDNDYWTDERVAYDAAGNASNTLTRLHLFDMVVPTVSNVAIPAAIVGWAPTTYTATATDNVDLLNNQPSNSFVGFGSYWQMGPGQQFGPGFVNPPVTSATISETFNQVISLQASTVGAPPGGGVPTGAAGQLFDIRFIVNDVALNQSVQTNTYAAGTVPAAVDFTGTGTTGHALTAPAAAINICDGTGAAGSCPAGTNTSVTVTYTTTGPTGTYAFPCSGELRFFELNAVTGVFDLLGVFPAPSVTDDGVTRTWTTSTTYSGIGKPVGNKQLRGMCIATSGGGWITQGNTNVTVIAGAP